MPRYRIHYLRESQRQHFRNAPPSPPPHRLKQKDYQAGGEIDAENPYAVWKQMREVAGDIRPIEIGDALEAETGALFLCRYVGFEEAQWHVPEPDPTPAATPAEPAPKDP